MLSTIFKIRIIAGIERLHRCIEEERVGGDGGEVIGVDCSDDDGPGGTPVPPEAGGESPPPSSSSLTFSLDGRRVSPLVHGLHGMGGARAPPRLDLSLCLSLFLRSGILPWHRFFYIWRSVTPIGLKPMPRYFSKN